MEIGIIGLGRMGAGIARRLVAHGHSVVGFDVNPTCQASIQEIGGRWVNSLPEMVSSLVMPRSVWLMLPPGGITQGTITELAGLLQARDTVVDGGNSHYKDSHAAARLLSARNVHFLDVGTNSGVSGVTEGYCLTVGGESDIVERHRAVFDALTQSPGQGWGHVGATGAGHFAKMVHNAVMYGAMQAYAEGFALLQSAEDLECSLRDIAEIWRHGSLVESRFLDLIGAVLSRGEELDDIAGWVEDTGAGRWAIAEAIERGVSTPAMVTALERRIRSREGDPYADRLLAALRAEFGGHPVKKSLSSVPQAGEEVR
jgi:6-phosphogluconate dehydrogenase